MSAKLLIFSNILYRYTHQLFMSRPTSLRQESESPGRPEPQSRVDFSTLYDRYAPALLGVITRLISDEAGAVEVLEATFLKVRSELDTHWPEQRLLFPWLLTIARNTAMEALNRRKQLTAPVFQLTATGKVVALSGNVSAAPVNFKADLTDPKLKELLDFVLFKNCTPEEAAASVGLPVETARQQLRLAMQQLRARSNG